MAERARGRVRTLFWAVGIGLGATSISAQNSAIDWSAMQPYEAHATAVTGQVTRIRDEQPWALSSGERVRIQQVISTGADGYARFEVAGGSSFELFANSRVIFRQNAARAGDLLDVAAGRVRIHLQPVLGQAQMRVFCPVAIIITQQPATIAVAVDEDQTTRIDVLEGEVRIQHTLLPRNEPVLVKAIDAVLVQKDQPISHKVERGSLYRYTIKIWSAITLGHSRPAEPVEQNKLLAGIGPSVAARLQ